MGVDIHIKMIVFNRHDGEWEDVTLFQKKGKQFKIVPLYSFRDYELFDILTNKENNNFPKAPLNEKFLPEKLQEEIKEAKKWCYGFSETTFADIKLYLHQYPFVPDKMKENPVKSFYNRLNNYLSFYLEDEPWDNLLSDIKILYWFDH